MPTDKNWWTGIRRELRNVPAGDVTARYHGATGSTFPFFEVIASGGLWAVRELLCALANKHGLTLQDFSDTHCELIKR